MDVVTQLPVEGLEKVADQSTGPHIWRTPPASVLDSGFYRIKRG
jgi:hypothetical protein